MNYSQTSKKLLFLSSLLLISLVFVLLCPLTTVKADTINSNLSLEQENECQTTLQAISNSFNKSVSIASYEILKNSKNENSAILTYLQDQDGNASGYMLFSYNNLRVIDFDLSEDGSIALNRLKQSASNEIKNGKFIYDRKLYFADSKKAISAIGGRILSRLTIDRSSTDSSGIIDSSPSTLPKYVHPVTTSAQNAVPTQSISGLNFVVTSNFSEDDNCAPTAGTNIAVLMNNTISNESYPYSATYRYMYKKMYTNILKSGTLTTDVRIGLTNYLKKYGNTKYNLDYRTSINEAKVREATDEGNPFYISLQGHSVYKNHGVAGYGWYKVVDDVGVSDFYIRIADGWSYSKSRYVLLDSTVSVLIQIKES